MAEEKQRQDSKAQRTVRGDTRKRDRLCENMTYAAREAFKRLRTNVLHSFAEEAAEHGRVIGITSAQPSEGKSTVSINLAYSMAELGKSVLLIDGDMRRPSLNNKLAIGSVPGLSNLLTDTDDVTNTVVHYESRAGKRIFDVLSGGDIPENPSELLNSKRFEGLIQRFACVYDYIIMDLPPINAVVDAVNASSVTDGMIVVLREGNCPRAVLEDCMEQLSYADANVLGFVVNGSVEGAGKRYQYAYRYGK